MDLKNIEWSTSLFIITYHVLLVALLPFYLYFTPPSMGMVAATAILFVLTGLGITVGYHRLYAHKAYELNKVAEAVILFFATIAVEMSALKWASVHRVHHRYSDSEKDPHNIHKGFFYAHLLWIFEKDKPADKKLVADLMKNKLVVFQDRHYAKLAIGGNVLVFLFVGWLLNDFAGALLLAVFGRMFIVHHFTWFINSLCHTWGSRSYAREQTAVNNALMAFVTFGEGYHNYHHAFATDYRNGVRWYQFDPSKWLIWSLSKLGLAWNLKRIRKSTIERRMVTEDKKIFLESIEDLTEKKRTYFERRIEELSASFCERIARFNEARKEYVRRKEERAGRSWVRDAHQEVKQARKEVKRAWDSWIRLSREIMAVTPIAHHH